MYSVSVELVSLLAECAAFLREWFNPHNQALACISPGRNTAQDYKRLSSSAADEKGRDGKINVYKGKKLN